MSDAPDADATPMASSPLDVSFETVGSALEEEDRALDDVVATVVASEEARVGDGDGRVDDLNGRLVVSDAADADAREAFDVGETLARTTEALTRKLAETSSALRESQRALEAEREARTRELEASTAAASDAERALEREREIRLTLEHRARALERELDDARSANGRAVEELRRELSEARRADSNRASTDARAYDVAEARAVASIAVADLQNTKREFHREWRRREVEYETTVRDLERRVSDLNARLSAASEDVERALSSRAKTLHRERDDENDESERISLEIVAPPPPSSPSSFLERSLRERLDAQRSSLVELESHVLDLCRGRREMAREILDLSRCAPSSDVDVDVDAALTARAREHRARAEAVACALAERVAALEVELAERVTAFERPTRAR